MEWNQKSKLQNHFHFNLICSPLHLTGIVDLPFLFRQYQSSANIFEKAVRQNPFHIQAWNDLATCYERNKNYNDAIDCYKHSLSINPTFYNSLLNLTAAYFNSGKINEAYKTICQIPVENGNKEYKIFLSAVLKSKLNYIIQSEKDELQKLKLEKKLNDNKYLFELQKSAQLKHTLIDSLFIKQSTK